MQCMLSKWGTNAAKLIVPLGCKKWRHRSVSAHYFALLNRATRLRANERVECQAVLKLVPHSPLTMFAQSKVKCTHSSARAPSDCEPADENTD